MTYVDIKRFIITSDWHFGVRSNRKEWLYMQEAYFRQVFIPFLKSVYQNGDVVLHLGDVFDNRQSIDNHVNFVAIDIVEEIAKICQFWVITGNHDIYRNKTNDINSLKSIKNIPNVKVFTEPEFFETPDRKFLLMPWRIDANHFKESMEKFPDGDYIFCHTDAQGAKYNRYVDIEEGVIIDESFKYNRVISGHIHYRQELYNGKLIFVGSPYQLTRSDMGNKKGTYILDLKTDSLTFFENDFSPQFKKIYLSDYLELTLGEFIDEVKNCFVDVYCTPEQSQSRGLFNLDSYLTNLQLVKRFEIKTELDKETYVDINEEVEIKSFDILELIKSAVELKGITESQMKKINEYLEKIYKEAVEIDLYYENH